ncbi:MAG TPA: MOSC N-terminal beta barrel domain-containing protein [Gemmatimonadaceae bacterium]|nr:MOSC N-terminal beta barrel domain-containing protein [Gemmatimonadaceae bacterium]
MPSTTSVGLTSVVALWRYPVKSMMGEELNAADLTQRGLLGDRAYALVDRSTGKVVSAKNPRKWSKLFDFRAALVEAPRSGQKIPPVRITLPNGTIATTEQEDLDQALSDVLGREVTLATTAPQSPSLEEYWPDLAGLAHRETVTDESMPAGTFFDFAVIHVLTTATIDRLRELYPPGRFEARRFRPNIVVEPASGAKGFVENDWIGHTLALGDEVRLSITGSCPRCVMTTLPQGDLPRDPGILRTAAQHNQVNVGVYANVVRGGKIRRGDPVRLE